MNYASRNDLNVYDRIIIDANQPILAISSTSFDISVAETLFPLMDGITICLADDEQVLSRSKLSELIRTNNVQILETTPTKMRLYITDPNDLQYTQGIHIMPYIIYIVGICNDTADISIGGAVTMKTLQMMLLN